MVRFDPRGRTAAPGLFLTGELSGSVELRAEGRAAVRKTIPVCCQSRVVYEIGGPDVVSYREIHSLIFGGTLRGIAARAQAQILGEG